jgi:hypothetical protein
VQRQIRADCKVILDYSLIIDNSTIDYPICGAYRDVGDFDLWLRFFRHARLYSVDALIGGYRFRSDASSATDMERYNERCDKTIESELKSIPWAGAVKVFRRVSSSVKNIPKVRGIWQRLALKSLYHLAGPDCPPVVADQENKWVIREGVRRVRGPA